MRSVSPHAPDSTKQRGVRERRKQERQERIIAAAREVFAEKGFESATLKQIAGNAGLGIATLFNYVTDKRDLIYLIFNEEMEQLVERALATPKRWQTFEAKILSITEPHYRLFAQDPVLSRILLSEVMLQTPGFHLGRFRSLRQRLIDGIEKLAVEAQETAEIDTEVSADMIARHIFFSFSIAILWWVASPQPHWRDGQTEFQRILTLQMNGLRPKQSARPAAKSIKRDKAERATPVTSGVARPQSIVK